MKRFLAMFIAVMLTTLAVSAFARTQTGPSEQAYKSAKEALSLISYGEYGMALKKLKLEKTITEKQLKKYIDANCKEIYKGSVQTDISVAWKEEGYWLLAVPFEAPEDEAVGALVFMLTEKNAFTQLAFMRWGDVYEAYSAASEVCWNVEYTPNYVIVEDW